VSDRANKCCFPLKRIFREVLSEKQKGIIVNGEVINNLRYADDTVHLASSQEDLQSIIDSTIEKCAKVGLDLNIKKIKVLVISKQENVRARIDVRGTRLEQVNQITLAVK